MKISRTPTATLMYREGILIIEFADGVDIGAKEAHDQIKAAYKITDNNPSPVIIIDHTDNTQVLPEARIVFASEVEKGRRLSEAFVITSLPKRLVINFYNRYHKPDNPVRVFSSFNEAWKWSQEIKTNHQK